MTEAFVADKHEGILGSSYSFATISDNGIIIRAIKKAEIINTDFPIALP